MNPIAGMGGSVGLHGTDGDTYLLAEDRGAKPVAARRAERSMRKIASLEPHPRLWTGARDMGELVARRAGLTPNVIEVTSGRTGPGDTRAVAAFMQAEGVDLILFAGGDGTARDIVSQLGTTVPILGIPTGVKMHSAVFAMSPEAAGDMAARFLAAPAHVPLHEREVLDVDPGGKAPSQFSLASVPFAPNSLQSSKTTWSVGSDSAVDRLCAQLAAGVDEEGICIVGPGTTANRVLHHLGLEAPARAVKVLAGTRLLIADASESQILDLLDAAPRSASIIIGVIGGQGFLLGRGNQQISPEVISRVGEEEVFIVASEEKIMLLDPPVLRVDIGIDEANSAMTGYRRVHTGPGRSVVMKVVA